MGQSKKPLNLIATASETSCHRYIFLYDDEPESLQALGQTICDMVYDPTLDFNWQTHEAVLQAAERNQLVEDCADTLRMLCEDVLYHLQTSKKGGVLCLLADLAPLYTILTEITHLCQENDLEHWVESETHFCIVINDRKKHVLFVRKEKLTPQLRAWPLVDFSNAC